MQRFRFRLDRVLEWRRKKYRLEETRLAACLALVQAAERKIELLAAERASIERELLDRPSCSLRFHDAHQIACRAIWRAETHLPNAHPFSRLIGLPGRVRRAYATLSYIEPTQTTWRS